MATATATAAGNHPHQTGAGRSGSNNKGGGGNSRGSGRGGSGGRSSRGSGRGGRGRGTGGGGGNAANKQDRKALRRQKQLDTMAKKARAEDDYFRRCRREAAQEGKRNGEDDAAREAELFAQQIAKGINFDRYSDIQVEVKVPPPGQGGNNKKGPSSSSGTAANVRATMDDFAELGARYSLAPQLRRNVQLMKYTHPTPIQKHAIPMALHGFDLMCCAQTGSGKTCAFLLPVIASISSGGGSSAQKRQKREKKDATNSNNNNNNDGNLEPAEPRCVVLAPTRELASQIELEAQKLAHGISHVRTVVVYGGANARPQLRELAIASGSQNQLIVVATPGRLTDFVDRNLVSLRDVQFLVLDEADRMLDMGFEPQIRRLVQQSGMTPKDKRQTLLFSATFPPAIQTLASEFLRPYVWIAVGRVGSTTDSITQVLIKSEPDKRHKLELVVDAMKRGPDGRTLIFVQKKRTATWLKKQLNKGGPDADPPQKHGGGNHHHHHHKKPPPPGGKEMKFAPIPAEEIHGDRSQTQRESALEKFRSGKCKVLVATDVAARGLDIGGVEHVINMDLPNAPDDFDSYVHRIGRTGRAGHEGLATSLFVPGDDPKAGNGRIAGLLVTQLNESKQEVPTWLSDLVAGGGGSARNAKPKPQFGGTDVRKDSSRTTNSKSANNGNRQSSQEKPSDGGRGNSRGGRGRGRGGGRSSGRFRGGAGGSGGQEGRSKS